MSAVQDLYKYGMTGFVDLSGKEAKKYGIFDYMYWLREYAVLLYLWPFETENIIKFHSGKFVETSSPEKQRRQLYHELIFDKQECTLRDAVIYKDQEIIQIMLDLLSAVKFLHSQKIMHRDIKRENILVTPNKRAILIDFTHAIRQRTQSFTLDKAVVTYSYRAPEIFNYQVNTMYTDKIDVWSLGIILFELVIGDNMHTHIGDGSEEDLEMFWKLKNSSDSYLKRLKGLFILQKRSLLHWKAYWKWISRMLEHDPEKRISASDMYDEIIAFANKKNIKYVVPKNGDKEAMGLNHPTKIRYLSDANKKLLDKCMEYVTTFRKNCSMHFTPNAIKQLITHLIFKGLITDDKEPNTFLAAACLILENAVFDRPYDVTEVLSIVNCIEKPKLMTFKEISTAIQIIINTSAEELFLYNTFNFDEDINILLDADSETDEKIPMENIQLPRTLTLNIRPSKKIFENLHVLEEPKDSDDEP